MKSQFEWSKEYPDKLLEYIPFDLNRSHRRGFDRTHESTVDPIRGVIQLKWKAINRLFKQTITCAYHTGSIHKDKTGAYLIGKVACEVVSEDPQTIFCLFIYETKRLTLWRRLKITAGKLWFIIKNKFRGLR